MLSLLAHIQSGNYKYVASTRGGEWHGPCPWCEGEDRFRVQPNQGDTGFYKCRRCGRSGDGIQFLRDCYGFTLQNACKELGVSIVRKPARHRYENEVRFALTEALPEPVFPPSRVWQQRAVEVAERAKAHLWGKEGSQALAYLQSRGLSDAVIRNAHLGNQPEDVYDPPHFWGLNRKNNVCMPKGIVIPSVIGDDLWQLSVRRRDGKPKYIGPAGFSIGLYGADGIKLGFPVVLVEGVFDALSVLQAAGDIVSAVATGSTGWCRKERWISRLSLASVVLVAFDSDDAGVRASSYWLRVLRNAIRLIPLRHDANTMLQEGGETSIRAWIEDGLSRVGTTPKE